jgi:hypothetical protein
MWRINITKNPQPGKPAVFTFEQSPPQVMVEDSVFWSNKDQQAHWPALATNQNAFMTNQIAPNSSSPAFAPAAATPDPTKTRTINYICWLHKDETGVIEVQPAPPAPPVPPPPPANEEEE